MTARQSVIAIWIVALALALAPIASAQVCTVCVPTVPTGDVKSPGSGPTDGGAGENAELQASLTSFGFILEPTNDPTTGTCTVYVSHPGQSPGGSGPAVLAWVQAGNGLVQISDWGPDVQSNEWESVGAGSAQTVDIVDPAHPITAGVPSTWGTLGFWAYDGGVSNYIGWVDVPDPNLARISGNDRGLSARSEGSGRVAYIGWNVYGSLATGDDLTILEQAVEWAGQCAGVPTTPPWGLVTLVVLLLAASLLAVLRRQRA